MSTTIASSAHAAQFATAGNLNAAIEANMSNALFVLRVEGLESRCRTTKLSSGGELTFPRSSIALHPTLLGCSSLILPVTWETNGCDFIFSAPGAGSGGSFPGKIEIACPPGKKIIVTETTCQVTIGPQTISTGVTLENFFRFPREVALNSKSDIAVTKVKDAIGCPFNGLGPATATLDVGTLAKAFAPSTGQQLELRLE